MIWCEVSIDASSRYVTIFIGIGICITYTIFTNVSLKTDVYVELVCSTAASVFSLFDALSDVFEVQFFSGLHFYTTCISQTLVAL